MDYEVKISPSAVREDLGEGTGLERTGAHEPAVRRSASYRTLTHRGEEVFGICGAAVRPPSLSTTTTASITISQQAGYLYEHAT